MLLLEIVKQTRFRAHGREVLAHAQGCRSGVALYGIRNGKLFAETTKAKWAEPKLNANGEVERLEIRCPYLDSYQKKDGKWDVRARMYRRVIDEQTDTTYKPADIKADSRAGINWQVDPELTVTHGLGFCPVVWYPFAKVASTVNRFDGYAIHEHILDEVEAHDFALSQRHRGALYAGEPQPVEIGVEPGSNPTEKGRGK